MTDLSQSKPNLVRLTPGVMMAIIGAGFVGRIMGDSAPVALGAMQDTLGFTGQQAGSVLSLDGLMGGLVGLFIGPFMNRISRRLIAMAGFVIVAVGLVAAILLDSFIGLLLARAVVGFGTGVMLATHNASFGALRDPDRASGIATVISSVLAAAFLAALPTIARDYGLDGLFTTQLIFVSLLALFMLRLPDAPEDTTADDDQIDELKIGKALSFLNGQTVLLLLGTAVMMMGEAMAWMMAERRGIAIGLSAERIGLWLGLLTFLGVVGAGIVALISTRFGRFRPWVTGAIALVAGFGLFHGIDSEVAFAAGCVLWSIGFFVQFPYLMGAVSVLDPQGRLGAIKGGIMILGSASGVMIAGILIDQYGPGIIAPISVGLGTLAISLIGPVVRRLDRQG